MRKSPCNVNFLIVAGRFPILQGIFPVLVMYGFYLLPLKYEPNDSNQATTMLTAIPMAP